MGKARSIYSRKCNILCRWYNVFYENKFIVNTLFDFIGFPSLKSNLVSKFGPKVVTLSEAIF